MREVKVAGGGGGTKQVVARVSRFFLHVEVFLFIFFLGCGGGGGGRRPPLS
jgi:hypothetical protein